MGVWKFSKKLVFNDLPWLYLLLSIPQWEAKKGNIKDSIQEPINLLCFFTCID